MARRSRKNDNSGCLGWIVLLGLAAALIEFLIPFVVVALVIWGIVALISAIVKNSKAQNERKANELRESVQSRISEYSLSAYVTNTAEKQFEPKRLPGWNQEVCDCFAEYYEDYAEYNRRINELSRITGRVLECRGCDSDQDKLNYLAVMSSELAENKKVAMQLAQARSSKKIAITEFDPQPLTKLRNAMSFLRHSKRVTLSTNEKIERFLEDRKPSELNCFSYTVSPVVLNFGNDSVYCFPKVILVFENGRFTTALHPKALSITVKQKETTARYDYTRNTYESNALIASDSKVIKRGNDRLTWRYTRKDGGRDMRYSDNPQIRYRDDLVAYGEVVIAVANYSTVITFSSEKALNALKVAAIEYCTNNAPVCDPIPLLLELLSIVGNSEDGMELQHGLEQVRPDEKVACCQIIEM